MTITADPTEFAGKRVLVSGGSKGLGRAAVERFLAGGARVITAAREAAAPIAGAEFVQADLTTAEGGERLAKAALERFGGIDILAHNLGGSAMPPGGFAECSVNRLRWRGDPSRPPRLARSRSASGPPIASAADMRTTCSR